MDCLKSVSAKLFIFITFDKEYKMNFSTNLPLYL